MRTYLIVSSSFIAGFAFREWLNGLGLNPFELKDILN